MKLINSIVYGATLFTFSVLSVIVVRISTYRSILHNDSGDVMTALNAEPFSAFYSIQRKYVYA